MNYQNFSEEIFKKKFFERWFVTLTQFQYFNSSAFLSRKRVQNYCFTAYHPNILNTFLLKICILLHKSLIIKRCRTTQNQRQPLTKEATLYLNIIIIGLFDPYRQFKRRNTFFRDQINHQPIFPFYLQQIGIGQGRTIRHSEIGQTDRSRIYPAPLVF